MKSRDQLVAVITKDRVIDASNRIKNKERIKNKKLFICQRHFTEAQHFRHETKTTLNPGVIPTLNLTVKSHSSPTITKPRESADVIQQERALNIPRNITNDPPSDCYKCFNDFKIRASALKLNGW